MLELAFYTAVVGRVDCVAVVACLLRALVDWLGPRTYLTTMTSDVACCVQWSDTLPNSSLSKESPWWRGEWGSRERAP